MPRSSRRLLDPQDHGSLEDITLHPQLGDLGAQPLELLDVVAGQPASTLGRLSCPGDPVAQRALVHAEVTCDLRDRLPRLFDDPDSTLTELPVVLLPLLWHLDPHCRCLYGPGGTSSRGRTSHRRRSDVLEQGSWRQTAVKGLM